MQSGTQSPVNRMIMDERKKLSLHKLASILMMAGSIDLVAGAFTFEPSLHNFLDSIQYSSFNSWTALIIELFVALLGASFFFSAYNFSKDSFAKHQRLFVTVYVASALFACFAIEGFIQGIFIGYIAQYVAGLVLGLVGIVLAKKSFFG
jgi:hypothetical protein